MLFLWMFELYHVFSLIVSLFSCSISPFVSPYLSTDSVPMVCQVMGSTNVKNRNNSLEALTNGCSE